MRIAINGFGRIGRLVLRSLITRDDLEFVAINDLTDTYSLAHLLKYDSAHGKLKFDVKANENTIFIGRKAIEVVSEPDPRKLPWKTLDIDVVLECTGRFRTRESMSWHLEAGAKKVILSAPAHDIIKTIVIGVNDHLITDEDDLLSNASCTTNCLAPMAKTLHDTFGIEKGFMTTVHAYTADQHLQDGPHKDLRRARAAAHNIVPTTSGASRAIGYVIPELKGKLSGSAIRVPVIDGSLTELTCVLNEEVTLDRVNRAFLKAAETNLHEIMQYSDEPIVSTDIIGNRHSCVYDAPLAVVDGNMVKVVGWYDNEYGYATRLADLAELVLKNFK